MIRMGREHEPPAELDPGLVAAYAATFIPRFDRYPLQLPDGRYVTLRRQLHLDLVTAHLKGLITLGAYALDAQSQARWVCFDADDGDQWQRLLAMAAHLEREAVTPYREPSRRGGHLWLFFEPQDGAQARRFARQLLVEHELENVELYPKQDALDAGPGSLVRLPLGRHRLTRQRYHFITSAGEPLAPTVRAQVRLLSAPARVPQAFIDQVVARVPTPEAASPTPRLVLLPDAGLGETLSERLKHRISVFDFVSQYVELNDRGVGMCPFHDDHHASFGVNREKNYWSCWAGCGGGSLIDFWSKWREAHGKDPGFVATITELADILFPRPDAP